MGVNPAAETTVGAGPTLAIEATFGTSAIAFGNTTGWTGSALSGIVAIGAGGSGTSMARAAASSRSGVTSDACNGAKRGRNLAAVTSSAGTHELFMAIAIGATM